MKNLARAFDPKRVAVIGASPDPKKIGHQILKNIIDGGYHGEIIPINPSATGILGLKAYKSISAVPAGVDLVLIAIPAPLVVAAMEECARCQVGAVAIITSGFGEVGNHADEDKLTKIANGQGQVVADMVSQAMQNVEDMIRQMAGDQGTQVDAYA